MLRTRTLLVILSLVLVLFDFVDAQSAGGGGGGAVGGLAVVCCPCISIVVCLAYINNRCRAHKLRTSYVNNAIPTTETFTPHSGRYLGNFKQGETTYDVDVQITFEKTTTQEKNGGKVDKYVVKGGGSDFMGNFRIAKGKCSVGREAHISFYKKYTMLYKGYTTSPLHKLLYTGEIRYNAPHVFSGNWEFVNMSESKECPYPRGVFHLEVADDKSPWTSQPLTSTPNPPTQTATDTPGSDKFDTASYH